ncbi:MAG: Tfp pilus assembly protein FimT/FimU [Desulfovibrio sp.]|jgi:MSHA pilin protein MshC
MTQAHRGTQSGGRAPDGKASHGFTLIEVITVLLIIGVLSALVVSRGTALNDDAAARKSELTAQLRYLQLRAMKNGVTYLVLENDDGEYWAYNSANVTIPLPLPGESAAKVSLAGKDMTMAEFIISFDRFGIPYSGSPQVKLAANATIHMAVDGQNATLVIEPETGFIH